MLLWRLGHKRHCSFHVGYSLLSLALGEEGGGQVTYMRKASTYDKEQRPPINNYVS